MVLIFLKCLTLPVVFLSWRGVWIFVFISVKWKPSCLPNVLSENRRLEMQCKSCWLPFKDLQQRNGIFFQKHRTSKPVRWNFSVLERTDVLVRHWGMVANEKQNDGSFRYKRTFYEKAKNNLYQGHVNRDHVTIIASTCCDSGVCLERGGVRSPGFLMASVQNDIIRQGNSTISFEILTDIFHSVPIKRPSKHNSLWPNQD